MTVRNLQLVTSLVLWSGCSSASDSGAKESPPPSQETHKANAVDSDTNATTPKTPDAQALADEVTTASPAYEAGPPVITDGSVDGAALRKKITERLKKDRSPIVVLRGKSAAALGKSICQSTVPNVAPDLPVLLKPNIGGFAGLKSPKKHAGDNGMEGRTTDPEFVRGVIQCLKDRGHKKITVADSKMADAQEWKKLVKVSGYEAMAKEEGVSLVAMSDDGVFDLEGDQPGKALSVSGMESTNIPTLLMPKIVAEHLEKGLYISLPKIKTHRFSVVSLGIKGQQGAVMYSDSSPAYRQKWRSHRELGSYSKARKKLKVEDREAYVRALEIFSERMTDVLEVQAPDVVLAEGAPAMMGDGFHTLIPIADMVAIGGTNPVLVDAVGARFLGLFDNADLAKQLGGHTTSPLITSAAKRFQIDLSSIKVQGNGADLVDAPRPLHFIGFAPFTLESGESDSDTSVAIDPPDKISTPVAVAVNIADQAIKLDGVANEAFWKNAKTVSWDTDFSGVGTSTKTQVRFAWNHNTLYAFFDLEDAGLNVDRSLPIALEREGLYKEDCVEIFLAPDASTPEHYYELEIGPYGHFHDIEVNFAKKKRFAPAWSSGIQIATTQDKNGRRATIEIAISSEEIRSALRKGARLPMGLFRMEGKSPKRKYLAWSPAKTDKPKFHIPDAFGVLVLE